MQSLGNCKARLVEDSAVSLFGTVLVIIALLRSVVFVNRSVFRSRRRHVEYRTAKSSSKMSATAGVRS